jgi:PQQ-dependent dehydrogenase (methanol/ethanol family)
MKRRHFHRTADSDASRVQNNAPRFAGIFCIAMVVHSPSFAVDAMADDAQDEWPSYNHRLSGVRYSELAQINAGNVNRLEEVCRVELAAGGSMSSGPVLAEGVMYVTTNNATVALDPTTCAIKWKTQYVPEDPIVVPNNRGVAYLAGRLFRGTGDGRLLSYDAASGTELWRKKIGNPRIGEFASAAPVAWRSYVFMGLSGGELGVRGRMMAFDAESGEKRWTFDLVPQAGQFGVNTWAGESWKHGGGATWSSYTLDEETGELFVSVDNPAPAFNGSGRSGNNLFTDSLVCIDAKTGRRLWHVQLLRHDTRDYGASAPAVLLKVAGRSLVAQGSKDGYLYIIDRRSHRIAFRTAVTTVFQNTARPAVGNTEICPGISGGFLYNSPSFDPPTHALISGTVDWCSIIHADPTIPHYTAGREFSGGSQVHIGRSSGWVTSVDVLDGHVLWRVHTNAPVFAAVTSTAGGITFTGDHNGEVYAFRSSDGTLLWHRTTHASIAGGLITYQIASKQYLAVESGTATLSPPSAVGAPTISIYSVD